MAVQVAVEGGAPKQSGQMSQEEMQDRFHYQLRAQADVWADRDPAYAKELRDAADSQEMLSALGGTPDYRGVKDLWAVDSDRVGYKTRRTVVGADGKKVKWDPTGWEQYEHGVQQFADDYSGDKWHLEGAGTLHNPGTGQWLAYRWNDDGAAGRKAVVDGRIADTLDEAAGHLTNDERAQLGLPANRPALLEVEETSKTSQAEMMKDLRRQLVADDAAPDAGLEFALKMQAARLDAVARGGFTEKSFRNRMMLQMEANRRGASITGWTGGHRQWEKEGRVIKPGATPFLVCGPVFKSAKADEDDETTGTAGGSSDEDAPSVRRFAPKQTAGGMELVGFRDVQVYDWTQTTRVDGQPDPDWKANVPGGNQELLERLKASSPFPVEYDHSGDTTGHAHGWTNGRKIVLDPNKSVGNQISTLAHEMTHAELDHVGRIQRGEMTREEAEQEAQLGAYFVVRSLDLGEDTDKSMTETTSAYLRNWSKEDGKVVVGHKQRMKLLTDRITPASDAAHRITTRLLGLDVASEQEGARQAA